MISLKKNYDAIVVGAGPAGSTTAALLAEKGHDVLVVEKEKFPRYHVGESLMPFCYFSLERLGLVDTLMESANPRKYCVQFVREDGFLSQPFISSNTLTIHLRQLGRFGDQILIK